MFKKDPERIKALLGKTAQLNFRLVSDNNEFDHYLKRFGYRFKNENKEFGGYAILNDKKISIVMDVGQSPYSNFSSEYQSGSLSIEIISNGKKYYLKFLVNH